MMLSALALAASLATAPLPILPMPAAIERGTGSLAIGNGERIDVPAGDAGAATAARLLADKVRIDRGLALGQGAGGRIRFRRDPAIAGAEAYRLRVAGDGVEIAASGDAGLVYGAMSLAELLSPDAKFGQPVTLPAVSIADRPRFRWRGVMLDVSRHFLPLPAVYATVDQMAAHKLNMLHLHLSDDQGWRVEIKRYPQLTAIGGWRTPPSTGGAPGAKVGGFYTQDELKALVAYAADRGVTIVPEIDLPGHAQALVASLPEMGVFGDRPPVGHDWGVNPYLLRPDDRGVQFVEHVLDELMAIFPGPFIHLGGDEAIKDQWQRSPAVQAQIRALGLKDENGLQSWLIDRFGRYLADHGRRLIGWDEILEGGLPPSASVMSWRGEKGAVDAAAQGHDVVLAPAPTLYMDSLQSDRSDEPPGRLSDGKSIVTLADLYRFEPMPAAIDPAKADHVLGAEVTAFAEYLVTPAEVQHALFPRLAALAEATWSPKPARDWTGFVERLQPQRLRYRREGIAAADSAFATNFALQAPRGTVLKAGLGQVAIATQSGYGAIRYTLDGRDPTLRSKAYTGPVSVPLGRTLIATAFGRDGQPTAPAGRYPLTRDALLHWGSSDMAACPEGALGLRVPASSEAGDGGPAYNVNLFDTCTMATAVPQDIARRFTVTAVRLPRHYGLAHDETKVRQHYAVSLFGELVMRAGGCDGRPIGTFPLPDPAASSTRMTFTGTLPKGDGDANVCFLFTAPISGPFYAVESLQMDHGQ